MTVSLLVTLRRELKNAADPKKAPQMQAYMKSKMPYWGVPSPRCKIVFRKVLAPLTFESAAQWKKAVLELWNGAEFREERYAALFLCKAKAALPFQTAAALPLYEKMIVTGAWWDYVDDLASHGVGPLLQNYPAALKPKLLKWSRDKNIWKRRTAILSQLHFGEQTDLKLLYACIEPSLGSKEFFLNKAIGWALRQIAWRDHKEVLRYVKANEARLSPLSQREALKNLNKIQEKK